MSDFIKVTRYGRNTYFHAWRVNGVFPSASTGSPEGSAILTPGGMYDGIEESPEEIIAMIDAIVNGPEPGPVVVPNFPGMEQN